MENGLKHTMLVTRLSCGLLLKICHAALYSTVMFATVCLLVCTPLPSASFAAEDISLDEALEGFDDEVVDESENSIEDVINGFEDDSTADETDPPQSIETDSTRTPTSYPTFALSGAARLRVFYNYAKDAPEANKTDWRGFSSLRGDLLLEADSKLGDAWQAKLTLWGYYDPIYDIQGLDEYTDDVTDTHVKNLEIQDTYIQGSFLTDMDIKVGRQVVVWGKSDNLRVCDVINPLYLREFGMTDIRDLRLPAAMVRLDYYWSNWSVSGMAIPEIRFNDLPVYGGDFYFQDKPFPKEEIPDSGIENMEYAFSVNGIFSGWDISLYFADIYDDAPYFSLESLTLRHARLKMYGAAWNMALGSWLIKAETAHFQGLKYSNTPDQTYSRTDLMAGIEYSGFKEISISFEALNRHLHDYDEALKSTAGVKQNETQCTVRLTKDWMNETLTLTLLASAYGADFQSGSFERFALEYDITDAWTLIGGLVLFQSGDKPGFENIGSNDRIFAEVKFSF